MNVYLLWRQLVCAMTAELIFISSPLKLLMSSRQRGFLQSRLELTGDRSDPATNERQWPEREVFQAKLNLLSDLKDSCGVLPFSPTDLRHTVPPRRWLEGLLTSFSYRGWCQAEEDPLFQVRRGQQDQQWWERLHRWSRAMWEDIPLGSSRGELLLPHTYQPLCLILKLLPWGVNNNT